MIIILTGPGEHGHQWTKAPKLQAQDLIGQLKSGHVFEEE